MGRTDTWDQRTKGECREHGTALVHCCWECFTAYGERVASERAHSARLAERVAELEQMYAEMKDAADKGSKSVFALAAEQAENARLREALDRLRDLAEIGLPMKATLVHAITHDVLAQSPSSNAALREVCRRVAMKGLKSGRVVMDDGTYVPLEDQAAQIVDAILGPEVTR